MQALKIALGHFRIDVDRIAIRIKPAGLKFGHHTARRESAYIRRSIRPDDPPLAAAARKICAHLRADWVICIRPDRRVGVFRTHQHQISLLVSPCDIFCNLAILSGDIKNISAIVNRAEWITRVFKLRKRSRLLRGFL